MLILKSLLPKTACLFGLLIFSNYLYCQERQKEPHYYYISVAANVYTNTVGTFDQKMFITAEFGKTFGIFDIGLLVGRSHLRKADSLYYVEAEPTINVFSKGRFSEALTLGAGYVFGAKENFLTEVTNSINFAPDNRTVITIFQGNYFFDGKSSTSKAQFMGLSVTFNLIKKDSKDEMLKKKSLLN